MRARYLTPPVVAAVVAALTAAATGAALLTGSAWPLAPLVVTAVPLARTGTPRRRALSSGGLVVAVGVLGLVVAGPVPAAGLLLAGTLAAVAGTSWRWEVDRLRRRLSDAQRQAEAVGIRDDATGCVNRHGLTLLGERVLQEVRRRGDSAHAVLVEVGELDAVRRRLGEHAADDVLAAVADALRISTRGTDVVSRWAPDLFAVVGPGGGTSPGELERRVRVQLLDDPPVAPALWPARLTAGAGVLEPWDAGGLPDLLARAEEDLSLRRALRSPSAPEPPVPPVPPLR